MASKLQTKARPRRRPADKKTTAKNDDGWLTALIEHLASRRGHAALADCPLPELYRALPAGLTIGQFHDGLRRLHESQQIYLHPWTGPLYEIPEPALALLVGHEIAYYVSLKI
jgi:hypothetical protein